MMESLVSIVTEVNVLVKGFSQLALNIMKLIFSFLSLTLLCSLISFIRNHDEDERASSD